MIRPGEHRSLLQVGRLVHYCYWPYEEAYIGRIFYTEAPKFNVAWVIPEYYRTYERKHTGRSWGYHKEFFEYKGYDRDRKQQNVFLEFDHGRRVDRAFNFGPVNPEQRNKFIIPGAEPFVLHSIKQSSCSTVKINHTQWSYYYGYGSEKRTLQYDLGLNKDMVDALPEPYKTRLLNAIPHCNVYKKNWMTT